MAAETAKPQQMVTIEIPADQVNNIDVNYKNQTSATDKVKAETNKTVSKTREVTNKTYNATKKLKIETCSS